MVTCVLYTAHMQGPVQHYIGVSNQLQLSWTREEGGTIGLLILLPKGVDFIICPLVLYSGRVTSNQQTAFNDSWSKDETFI